MTNYSKDANINKTMSIRVYTQNASESLSGDGACAFAQEILTLQPDIGLLTEAYNLEMGLTQAVQGQFEAGGYRMWHGRCSEENRGDIRTILGFAKKDYLHSAKNSGPVQILGRTAIEFWLRDPETSQEVHAVGEHGNDRPARNVQETKAILTDIIKPHPLIPTLWFGDKNSMHHRDALRPDVLPGVLVARAIAKLVDMGLVPDEPPQTIDAGMSLGRLGNLAVRYRAMSRGESMALLTMAGFVDADRWHRSTVMQKHVLGGQIDHIMLSTHDGVPNFRVRQFRRLARKNERDHVGLLADLELLPAAV